MFNLGMGEITVILLLALIFLGPTKLPELAAGLGKMIREIRKATSDVKNEIALDDTFRKPFEELRDAVTLHPEELKRRDRVRAEMEEVRRRSEEAARAAAEEQTAKGVSEGAPAPEIAALGPPSLGPAVPPPPVTPEAVPAPTLLPSPMPPPGTVSRRETLRRVAPGPHAPPRPPVASSPRVVPPTSTTGDRSNTTQFLTEDDLMPGGSSGPPQPPPVPSVGSGAGSGKVAAVPVTQAGKVPLPGSHDAPGAGPKRSDET